MRRFESDRRMASTCPKLIGGATSIAWADRNLRELTSLHASLFFQDLLRMANLWPTVVGGCDCVMRRGGCQPSDWAFWASSYMGMGTARTDKLSWKKKVLSPSFNHQRSLVSVPNRENRVSYVSELSKPSIFSPLLVLMVVFNDVQRALHVKGGPHSLFFSPRPMWKAGAARTPTRGDMAARGRKEAPAPKLLPWCRGVAAPTGLCGERGGRELGRRGRRRASLRASA
jgi:hypothetical protein